MAKLAQCVNLHFLWILLTMVPVSRHAHMDIMGTVRQGYASVTLFEIKLIDSLRF